MSVPVLLFACVHNGGRHAAARAVQSGEAFAALCGSNPIPTSSGKTTRHRLNRGCDPHANSALWRIVVVRRSCDQRTRDYVERPTAEGKSKSEIRRCLKRYFAREVYQALPPAAPS